jgi:hypothetical protein
MAAICLLGFSSQAFCRTWSVITTGTTVILEGNLARARNAAIGNGKRNALENAVRGLIGEDAVFENYEILNQIIYQQHQDFIDTYRILSETSRENHYEVILECTVIVEKLRETLVSLGLMDEEPGSDLSRFQLEIVGVSCSPCLRALKAYLQDEMEGIHMVSLYSISPGRFTFDIVFRGDIEAFRNELVSGGFESFRLEPEAMDERHLQVVMVLTQSEDG